MMLGKLDSYIQKNDTDSHLHGQLIYDKWGKNIQWGKDSLFNKWCWENWTATYRRMKLDHSLIPYTKITSKWMKELNVRQESIKILKENIGCNLFDISHSNFFQDTSWKTRKTKAKMNFWDFIKIKTSAEQRKQSTKLKENGQNGRRYLQMTCLIKD